MSLKCTVRGLGAGGILVRVSKAAVRFEYSKEQGRPQCSVSRVLRDQGGITVLCRV